MSEDQRAEYYLMVDLLKQSEPERKIRYKKRTYYTFLLNDSTRTDQSKIRLIVGTNGRRFCPADKDIKECLWL